MPKDDSPTITIEHGRDLRSETLESFKPLVVNFVNAALWGPTSIESADSFSIDLKEMISAIGVHEPDVDPMLTDDEWEGLLRTLEGVDARDRDVLQDAAGSWTARQREAIVFRISRVRLAISHAISTGLPWYRRLPDGTDDPLPGYALWVVVPTDLRSLVRLLLRARTLPLSLIGQLDLHRYLP